MTAMENTDWLDRMLILAAVAFFILVVLFVLKQRIVDRGLRIAFFWTRFIPDFSGDAALNRLEQGKLASIATASVTSAVVSARSSNGDAEVKLGTASTESTESTVLDEVVASLSSGLSDSSPQPVTVEHTSTTGRPGVKGEL